MSELQSHPHLTLAEHIAQVREAAEMLWDRHSPTLRATCSEAHRWIADGVTLHDAGKGSQAFQEYILDPPNYKGNRRRKAHTPLSTLVVLKYAEQEGWAWQHTLAVATLAAGHHSEFKHRDKLLGVLDTADTADLDDILDEQLGSLDWEALDRALAVRCPRILGTGIDVGGECIVALEELFGKLEAEVAPLRYRLLCQLAFSILLEADKAYLAIDAKDIREYFDREPATLSPSIVDPFLASKDSTPLDSLRSEARRALFAGMGQVESRMQTMTLPTGTGKTLLAASWALHHREKLTREKKAPRVIVVLPYLAIIDQTVNEYHDLLEGHSRAGDLLSYHSLSERTFDKGLEDESNDFFVDTWQSDVVITTFDQFLFALMSPRGRHQMRFHHLTDAIVVLDEIQTLPCQLWDPLNRVLCELTKLGQTHVLAMSATQPGFLDGKATQELIPNCESFYGRMNRYRFEFRHREPVRFSEFVVECKNRLPEWEDKRILITPNTRQSARRVLDELVPVAEKLGLPWHFISGDVTPRDRLQAIAELKNNPGPCLVVSTQCIEAGVDIDMDHILRDFAPLDSLVQIAGRCNRNSRKEIGIVEVVKLLDDSRNDGTTRPFCSYIYDTVLTDETLAVLAKLSTLEERDIFPVTKRYFDALRAKKDLGQHITQAFAQWQETESVRKLLRGAQRDQVSFLVPWQDPTLRDAIQTAMDIKDRWKCRSAMRKLASRIAAISVTVYVPRDENPEKYPEQFADRCGWLWILNDEHYYTEKRGLNLDLDFGEESWGTLL